MLPRFHVPELDPLRAEVELPPGEAHHLARVLRLGASAEIAVFDGRGAQFRAVVTHAARDSVRVRLLERLPTPSGPAVSLTLVQSLLKTDSMDSVVRDATMVGVAAIQPVTSERTVARLAGPQKAVERWRRIALASAKQCGQARLPRIGAPVSLYAWFGSGEAAGAFLLVEPAIAAGARTLRDVALAPPPGHAVLIVGPEGGWSSAEYEAACAAGCVPLSLGRLTLRAESVPLVAAAAVLASWDAPQLELGQDRPYT